MGGRDQGGAVGRDQAALHRAPGLHHLGGDDDVDVAGVGIIARIGVRPLSGIIST